MIFLEPIMRFLPLFYRVAAGLMVLNAALHLFAVLPPGGFGTLTAQMLLPAAPLYALLAWGLFNRSRWVAWIQFFVALLGALVAFAFMPLLAVPAWWAWAIVALDVDVAILMLLILWPSRQRVRA